MSICGKEPRRKGRTGWRRGEEENRGVWWLTVFGRPGEVLSHVFAGAESGYPLETRHRHTCTPEVRGLFKVKGHRLFQMSYERDRKTTDVRRNSVLITIHKPEKKCVKNSFQAEEHNTLLHSTYKGLLLKI